MAAHPGRRATRRLISSRYVWKGLSTDVTAWVKACLGCQRAKVYRHVQVPPQHILVPARRFSHIHVDLVGPLPASKGFTYLFTIIDRTSCWPEAIPVAATTTVDCANALFQGWVSRFRVLAVITSDRGAQFTSSLWAALCSLLNIQHNQTTAYHPQSNGMVKHFHRHLKDASAPAAQRRIGSTTFRGSSWASAQRPEKTTAPPPLRKCSAHHSFYMANF